MPPRRRPAQTARPSLMTPTADFTLTAADWLAATSRAAVPEGAKLHDGIWLREDERHLVDHLMPGQKQFMRLPDGRPGYQRHKYTRALPHVAERQVFVDIGAHCGLWSMQAELDFDQVIAFEPLPAHGEIYPFNMRSQRWTLHRCALGDACGMVEMDSEIGSSGNTHVAGEGNIPMRLLDNFRIERIDLLKIDTEGYELPIVRGAIETLKRCRPVVVIEQKGKDRQNFGADHSVVLDVLRGLGMVEVRDQIGGDWFFGWR